MRGKLVRMVILGGMIAAGCALTKTSLSDARAGRPAPVLEGVDADGRFFRLADYSGRVVMISFWGNFCPPCRALFPHEKELVQKYQGRPFVLLGVNGDTEISELKNAQLEKGLTWRSWWDGPSGPISRSWGVEYFPTVFLIDHTGVIRYRSDGSPDRHQLDAQIEKLLPEVPTAAKAG